MRSTDIGLKRAAVSLVAGESRYGNIARALDLIGLDLETIRGRRNILIKPNLTATSNEFANTSVEAVESVLDYLMGRIPELQNSRFTIFEGSGSAYYENTGTRDVFDKFGYGRLTKKYKNVFIECVEDFPDSIEVGIRSIAGDEKIRVTKRFFDFDFRISVALPKTHNYAIATFGIKNMAGMISQEDKSLLHGLRTPSAPDSKTIFTYLPTSSIAWMRRRAPGLVNFLFKRSMAYLKATKVIHHNVAAMAVATWPDLVVLDGYYFMDGNGPVDGYPVEKRVAVCSTDALKADGLGARLMGLEPEDIGYLYYLREKGMGDYSLDGLVGDNLERLRSKFKMHPTYAIQKQWRSD